MLVKDGEVLATGVNEVAATNDPTAHAEVQAIRAACRRAGALRLDGCVMFASGHPCPMCLTAMYLTGVRHVYCAFSLEAGEPYGLSTANIYSELAAAAAQRSVQVVCSPVHVDGLAPPVFPETTARDGWRSSDAQIARNVDSCGDGQRGHRCEQSGRGRGDEG